MDGVKLKANQQILIDRDYVETIDVHNRPTAHPPSAGEVYEGRVFESGGYIRNPAKVDEILGKVLVQDRYGFQFYSFLYLID